MSRETKRQCEDETSNRPDAKKHKVSQPPAAAFKLSPLLRAPQLPPAQLRSSQPLPPPAHQTTETSDTGAGSLAGPFVTGVLSGQFLMLESESNRKKALSNILLCATGHSLESAPERTRFPPGTICFNLRQAQALADGFLQERDNAVSEAVRIAYMEMKSRHEDLLSRSTGDPNAMKTDLKDKIEAMEKEYVQQKQKLMEEVKRYKDLYDSECKIANALKKAMEEQVSALRVENSKLKTALKHAKSSAAQTLATQVTRERPEELEELREKIQQQQVRHARSISAYMKASVHSLRMLRRSTNVIIPGDEDDDANQEDEKAN